MYLNKSITSFLSFMIVAIFSTAFVVGCAKKKARKIPVAGSGINNKAEGKAGNNGNGGKADPSTVKKDSTKDADKEEDSSSGASAEYNRISGEFRALLAENKDITLDEGDFNIQDKITHMIERVSYEDGKLKLSPNDEVVSYDLNVEFNSNQYSNSTRYDQFQKFVKKGDSLVLNNSRVLQLPRALNIAGGDITTDSDNSRTLRIKLSPEKNVESAVETSPSTIYEGYNLVQLATKLKKENTDLFKINKDQVEVSQLNLGVKEKANIKVTILPVNTKEFKLHLEIERSMDQNQQRFIEHFLLNFKKN